MGVISADLRLEVLIHNDLEGPEELGVLRGQVEFGIGAAVGFDSLAMHQIDLAALVEPNGDFQNQKEVVAGIADTRHDICDPIRIGE